MIDKWDYRFARLAKEVSSWSKDPSRKIGCVAVKNRRVLATGYNGFPKGIPDLPDALADRELKYKLVVHGEMNCIYNAAANGVSLEGSTFYVTTLPVCSECAKGLIQSGVSRVVMAPDMPIPDKWVESFELTKQMFLSCGVQHSFIDLTQTAHF
jgi:dCMP deaminase